MHVLLCWIVVTPQLPSTVVSDNAMCFPAAFVTISSFFSGVAVLRRENTVLIVSCKVCSEVGKVWCRVSDMVCVGFMIDTLRGHKKSNESKKGDKE